MVWFGVLPSDAEFAEGLPLVGWTGWSRVGWGEEVMRTARAGEIIRGGGRFSHHKNQLGIV